MDVRLIDSTDQVEQGDWNSLLKQSEMGDRKGTITTRSDYTRFVCSLSPWRQFNERVIIRAFVLQMCPVQELYMKTNAGIFVIAVIEWGDDVHTITEDEAVMLVNHQATGDVCTLMMCLQDKGLVVRQMMWLMDHIFKYTNFGVVSLVHGDFFIRQGKAYRDQQLVLLKVHLEKYYRSRDRKWIILFPEGGFLRKRRETSQLYAKKNNLPFLTHVTLPRLGATQVILNTLLAQQENGTPAGGHKLQVGKDGTAKILSLHYENNSKNRKKRGNTHQPCEADYSFIEATVNTSSRHGGDKEREERNRAARSTLQEASEIRIQH
ncbi:unnamed protein product [Ranitomeya imitator]|uniref:Phospholipid/glycerol acyltransferase domain-containing protein n=1 Tax=Ranitomeya imitator TaxID=111125 RepID=A0ABN9MMT1_9NEOB|nr:unnamed protein product [Ranitomeya imitator]